MENEMMYSVNDILEEVINKYQLYTDVENCRTTYRAKIYRTLYDLGIWEQEKDGNGKTKRKEKNRKCITEKQKSELLASKDMHDYLIDHSKSDEIRNRKKYDELQIELNQRRNAYIKYLDSQGENDLCPVITSEEYTNYKNNIMLKAIFEHFFTPIDDSLLEKDLYTVLLEDNLSPTAAAIEAENRLANPEKFYFQKKESNESKQ